MSLTDEIAALNAALKSPDEAVETPLERWWRENPDAETEPRNPYQKWRDNDTRKGAIEAQCMRCMGTDDPDNPQPGYRRDIRECSDERCPLYNWRPYK